MSTKQNIKQFLYVDWVLCQSCPSVKQSDTSYTKKVCLEVVDDIITLVSIQKDPGFDNIESYEELPMRKINSGYYVVNYKRYTIPVHMLYGRYIYDHNREKYPEPFNKYQIDHIDRQRDNLNIKNMRLVSISENLKNRDPKRHEYKTIEIEKDVINVEFFPITLKYLDFQNVEHYLTIYKHDGTFYRIGGYRYYEDKVITIYKEIPYRHDRDITPGNRTYLIRYNRATHEYKEENLNILAEYMEFDYYGVDEVEF